MDGSNDVYFRNVYPDFPGPTSGLSVGAASAFDGNTGMDSDISSVSGAGAPAPASGVDRAVAVGSKAKPFHTLLVVGVIFVVIVVVLQRYGGAEKYANIRASFVNGAIITITAIIGINIAKVVFTKVPVPGVSTLVLNA